MASRFLSSSYLKTTSNLFRCRLLSNQDLHLQNFINIKCSCNILQCRTFTELNTTYKYKIPKTIGCLRKYSTEPAKNDDPIKPIHKKSLPMLMDFPEIIWPSILKSIKNWILINFIIQPYFDKEFSLPDFVFGTKQAVQIVSSNLADGDILSLAEMVDPGAIKELKPAMSTMSMTQRSDLRIKKEDIYLTFPYQVGIMFDDESNEQIQKRWVEITMVFHVFKGLKEMQDRGQTPPLNMGVLPEYRDNVSICNYRFIKEFTQGNESEWTINVINHFKPSDYITEK